MENENQNLATEMFKELQASAHRWFLLAMAMLIAWLITVGLIFWYISLPTEEESYSIEQSASDYSENNIVGGDYYPSDTKSKVSESTP